MKNFPKEKMMKILFLDNSADLGQRWVEPLREKGWGVVRARSVEDADRMMTLHGDALHAIVVSEKFVNFAEKNDLVFVVLTQAWGDKEIAAHQNSDHAALAYVPYQANANELMSLFDSSVSAPALKATGTDGAFSVSLESYGDMLSQPESTKTGTLSLVLDSPSVLLGGAENIAPAQEVQELHFDETPQAQTMILDTSAMSFDLAPEENTATAPLEAMPSFEPEGTALSLDAMTEAAPIEEISSLDDLLSEPPEFKPESGVQSDLVSPPLSQLAINPHPTANLSDVETLKSYLSLREQDVALLSGQLRSSQERIRQLELTLKVEQARTAELSHLVSKQDQTIKGYNQEKQVEFEVMENQIEDLNQQVKDRVEKSRSLETKLRLTQEEISKMKERVRVDIRKIRVREKELENQLEVLKKDSSALLTARDEKVLELKRKIDLLEFNMELIQEQYSKERHQAEELKARLKEAATVMKQAGGMLEQ